MFQSEKSILNFREKTAIMKHKEIVFAGDEGGAMSRPIENIKEKIMTEAQRQLKEGGYNATMIQSIARACGVGVGTVYNYFSSKDEIMIACMADDWKECLGVINTVSKYAKTYDIVVHCIYDQVQTFVTEHAYVFHDEAAAASVDGVLYRQLWYLSQQVSVPLRKFCRTDAEAQIIAEALLTWIRTGKSLEEICASVEKFFEK